ncbi:MAG: polyprenyl synthetase family protein, partial [Chloroflexota bacterium]
MDPAATLAAFLTTARGQVDEALERYLPSPPACPAIISAAMRYSVFAGGKRLRPLLTLAAADAVARAAHKDSRTATELAL